MVSFYPLIHVYSFRISLRRLWHIHKLVPVGERKTDVRKRLDDHYYGHTGEGARVREWRLNIERGTMWIWSN